MVTTEAHTQFLNTLHDNTKELSKFPDGRIDYSGCDFAYVLIIFVRCENKYLLLKRSSDVLEYKNFWATPGGYIDEVRPIEEKIYEELEEELSILHTDILDLTITEPIDCHDCELNIRWVQTGGIVEVEKTPDIKLNYEHTKYKWVHEDEIQIHTIPPGTIEMLEHIKVAIGTAYFEKI